MDCRGLSLVVDELVVYAGVVASNVKGASAGLVILKGHIIRFKPGSGACDNCPSTISFCIYDLEIADCDVSFINGENHGLAVRIHRVAVAVNDKTVLFNCYSADVIGFIVELIVPGHIEFIVRLSSEIESAAHTAPAEMIKTRNRIIIFKIFTIPPYIIYFQFSIINRLCKNV